MRKLLVAILAVPVLVVVYAASALGRSGLVRASVAISLGAIVALGAMSFARPTITTATPPTDIVPLTQAAFATAVGTNVELDSAATIRFSTPMARASVEAAITVEPLAGIELRWTDDDTVVSIGPTDRWAPGTYYTITVRPGALASTGRPTTTPARSAFLTRAATTTVVEATTTVGSRVAIDSVFTITFDRPVDPASVTAAVRLEPVEPGEVAPVSGPDGTTTFSFTPSSALKPDTRYRLVVDGVRDIDGAAIASVTLAIRTSVAPGIVRFRPRPGTEKVTRDAAISVRFTRSMERATTKKAFKVTADGKAVKGTVHFAEKDTVLVFDPDGNLPYGAKIVARVAGSARSVEGVALGTAAQVAFNTVAKPVPAVPTRTGSTGGGGGGGGGGTVGSGSWSAVERYYLGLMNCTRTGGTVTTGGGCSSPGGRNVAALKLDAGISSKVARPYAKKLAVNNMCTHFSGGNPGDRLRRAGYTSYRWAENLGCRSGNPRSAVLGSHLFFQSERSWSPLGGHYVNLMNSAYDRAGIGVWVSGGRVRLVVDFYHP